MMPSDFFVLIMKNLTFKPTLHCREYLKFLVKQSFLDDEESIRKQSFVEITFARKHETTKIDDRRSNTAPNRFIRKLDIYLDFSAQLGPK